MGVLRNGRIRWIQKADERMITDAVMGLLLGVIRAVLGVIPEVPAPPDQLLDMAMQVSVWLSMANYLFPLEEGLSALAIYFGVMAGVGLYRFFIRIKPW